MKIRKFLVAIWSDWAARMSGPLTVPFTILAFFAPYRVLFAILAVTAALITCYRVWVKECLRAEAESQRSEELRQRMESKHADVRGQILTAHLDTRKYIGNSQWQQLDRACYVMFLVETVNHNDQAAWFDKAPTVTAKLAGRKQSGVYESLPNTLDLAADDPAMGQDKRLIDFFMVLQGIRGSRSLEKGRPVRGWLRFRIEPFDKETTVGREQLVARDVSITFIDTLGKSHEITQHEVVLQIGRIGLLTEILAKQHPA